MSRRKKSLYLLFFLVSFLACLFSIHTRTKTTMLGYQLGQLKAKEANLLIENSLLNMELSKITTKSWLLNFLNKKEEKSIKL